jgi:hypothetical protein
MEIKDLLGILLDPKLLAAAGGYAAYHFWGRKHAGFKPWAYAGGGMVAGYLIGRVVQGYLQPGQVPAATTAAGAPLTAAEQAQLQQMIDQKFKPETVDLDSPPQLPTYVAPVPGAITPSGDETVSMGSSIAPEDMAIADAPGSYGDALGGEGLGSYTGTDHDRDVDELMKEIAKSTKQRGRA